MPIIEIFDITKINLNLQNSLCMFIKRLIPLEKIRRFTFFSIAISIFAYCLNLLLSIFQWPELYYPTIFMVAIADTFLFYLLNVFSEIREALEDVSKRSIFIFFLVVLILVATFFYFYGLEPYSVLLSLCTTVPVVGLYLYFFAYYVRNEKLRIINRAIQQAGHN